MRTRLRVIIIGILLLLGYTGLSSAASVTDPTGDAIGPTDIQAMRAEQFTRLDGITVLKICYTATPNLGGIVIFEADVDSSTGTGGTLSMTGIPVAPCPCKTTAGMDVAIVMLNREQDANASTALCAGCTDSAAASCGTARHVGEWYAVASFNGTNTNGVLRGYTDPMPVITRTKMCYTFPWFAILAYAKGAITNPDEQYDFEDAADASTTKWQLSVWTDAAYALGNQDDFADGTILLNVSDWAPNTGLVNGLDVGSVLTYCEGNFDGDADVDATDAMTFKIDHGRSDMSMGCPSGGANQYY